MDEWDENFRRQQWNQFDISEFQSGWQLSAKNEVRSFIDRQDARMTGRKQNKDNRSSRSISTLQHCKSSGPTSLLNLTLKSPCDFFGRWTKVERKRGWTTQQDKVNNKPFSSTTEQFNAGAKLQLKRWFIRDCALLRRRQASLRGVNLSLICAVARYLSHWWFNVLVFFLLVLPNLFAKANVAYCRCIGIYWLVRTVCIK